MNKTRLSLIEPTKLLERITVDNLRFLNSLGHDYSSGAYNIEPVLDKLGLFANFLGTYEFDPANTTTIKDELYKNVYLYGDTIDIYQLSDWKFDANGNFYYAVSTPIEVIAPNGDIVWTGSTRGTSSNVIGTVKLDIIGAYSIKYYSADKKGSATYTIYSIGSTAKKPYTITDVINRILNAGVGAWNGYYKLDPALAEKWSKIEAPEFEITGKTLFEALLMVGGYKNVQGIPRLKPTPGSAEDWEYNFITFDLLNENKEWIPPRGYIAKQEYWDGESYCGGLESYVDNFVDNSKNGTTSTPFPTTVRTESSDLVINDNYAIIKTELPIYKVYNVEQSYINDDGEKVGSILPYIFEKSEYDNLTSYKGEFPYAKQFALYYVQGQPNLYGLVLKPETANALDLATSQGEFAAVQIAEKKSGQEYETKNGIASFAYRVTYAPISTRRIRQFRPTRDFPNGNMLYYNQSSNVVDSRNYGSRMKGELARIGNKVELETYRLFKLADMPKPGMKKDGKYISQVDWEMQLTSIKVTIYLVKNYNRISEYIGINSMQRFYEVSEKQATYRPLNFSYISQIGKGVTDANTKTILNAFGIEAFERTFTGGGTAGAGKIKKVVVTAYAKDGTQIQSPTVHSVCGNGIGNSMSFFWTFADNYSAGDQALYKASAKKVQRAVPYGDEYGELYSLKMDFYPDNAVFSGYENLTYDDQVSTATKTAVCDLFPAIDASKMGMAYMSYTAVVDKNSGEKISVETQIHFQANEPDVIIGSALGEDNNLVNNEEHTHTFVCLPYELEQLQESIPVEDIAKYAVTSSTVRTVRNSILLSVRNTTSATAKSWANVNEKGSILIGKNETVEAGAYSSNVTISFDLTID